MNQDDRRERPTARAIRTPRRVCLVTDVSSDAGRAFCRAYAHRHSLVGLYRDELPTIASQLEAPFDPFDPNAKTEAPIYAVRADASEPDDVRRVLEIVRARYGRLDLIVHTGAHRRSSELLFEGDPVAALREHMATNVESVLGVTLEAARAFWRDGPSRGQRGGRVVCFAPPRVPVGRGAGLYAASMGALRGLAEHLRAELAMMGVDVDVFPDVDAFAATENALHTYSVQSPA